MAPMNRRRLYLILRPESANAGARIFRIVHHLMVATGIAVMLTATVAPMRAAYATVLAIGFYVVATFFVGEYALRLIAAPAAPGGEHRKASNARLAWAVSLGGLFDLLGAIPLLIGLVDGPGASLFGFIWAFKYVRYSPGLASLGRVIRNARQALLSVLLGFAIALLTAASIAYLLERHAHPDHPEAFASIPAALWWGIVTMTTTGYGDIVPQTIAGRALSSVAMVGGILIFALWTGILVNGYAEELRRREFLRTWELVAKVPFFHNIGATLIAEVARLLRPRDLAAGTVIVRRGEPGDCMYFVVEGEYEVQLQTGPIRLGSGQFFGELALLTGEPRNATVVATRDCTLLVLDIVDFHELLGRQPELARVIREEARKRLGADARHRAMPAIAADGSE
ncbi:MAG TPA: cyclic nucleotide-gated ion channel [Stellaceae bacterium]|jgi:voltage-gated potassium channel|nr:cyclic nucleotide-gated ion channel [Stellaceae bacterium]